MYLKSIELSGFKSFAKKNIFEFDSPISVIVGPNGSGKSNVAEAFRFVLGEQSVKSMRGKRGEDLIWNGAASEPRANRASVKVIFDNLPAGKAGTKKIFDLDFSEVIIERIVHRDGLNEYLINHSPVRLKDILELLARACIGASGHHIISQGEADKILSASPKDRKGIIEDALGLRLYQYKRLESERKLKKTFENIQQVEALRKEIAPHLRFLGKQVEKIKKTEEQRQTLIKLSQEYFKREQAYLTFSKTALLAERGPLNKALEKLSKESQGARKVLELESGLSAIRKQKDDLTRELGQSEGLIMAEEKAIENEKKLLASDEFKTVRLKDVESLYQEISALSSIAEIKNKFSDFIKDRKYGTNSKLISEAEARLGKLKERQKELEKLLEAIKEKEQKISEAEKAVFQAQSLENTLVSKLNLLKAHEESLKKDEEEFKRELNEVGHLVGPEALRLKDFNGEEKLVVNENRQEQEERKRVIEKFKIRLEDSNVTGMEEVHKEYKETHERDAFLARELLDLEKSAETLSELIKELETRLAVEFNSGLEKINREFNKLFVSMFGGGEASLVLTKEAGKRSDLEETEEEVEEGLDIKVNLPKKKIRGLMMLSGGERALQVNPPPFIILDETDAALDESNSKRYGDLVETLSKHSQLILITHNRETMSHAGVIYGVTMGSNGISKLLSISFDQAVEVAK
ncbi:MAG: Chromosome partition protein smc [Candidatus Azambacteria bacterium GW2011_GWF2_42_22]|nr:MAG: Chromosome partition protein smc [Candidatus Azambacteria bacterium GW2011_GWF2_42_22]